MCFPFARPFSTQGLQERFGKARVFDTPLSENGMTGILVGAALTGLRPVMTHQRLDFVLYAMDQLVNHAAKRCYASGGRQSVPLTVRAVIGRGWGQGPQHSQSLQAFFMHVPGLKVVMPATAYDAKGLLLASIFDPNPVVFIEHRSCYAHTGEVPQEYYTVALGKAAVPRSGEDVTLVATSYMVSEALRAAEALAREGIRVEVIDLRTIKPWDEGCVLESVKKTGRLVIADTGWKMAGVSAEIAACVVEAAFSWLKAPILRVALPDVPTPTGAVLEKAYYPGPEDLVAAVRRVFGEETASGKSSDPLSVSQDLSTQTFRGPF
ncbi:MAG: alpha-ketoacid dehydrogenase subunit beta [Candidatus Omnitrophica bacterium]|nr:alpha-ketoacid dehydrogenase subunit beta [Candidatus Omnitrophota bacterium]